MSWDIPKCSPGCSDAWIGDGYCDKACNNSACNFDYPDCINSTTSSSHHHHHHGGSGGGGHGQSNPMNLCVLGCPDSWLGDRICDQRCKNEACGWDLGDCGLDLVTSTYPGVAIDEFNADIMLLTSSSSLNGYHYHQQLEPQSHYLNGSISESNDVQQSSSMNTSNDDGIRSSNNGSSSNSNSNTDDHSTRTSDNNRNNSYLTIETSLETPSSSLPSSSSLLSSSSSYIAPTLSVAYGTKAVYYDLAYLACLYHDSNNISNSNNINRKDDINDSSTSKLICDLNQLDYTLFTYEDASHNDDSRVLIHSSTILRRHFLFVVLLFHGQYDMPQPAVLPMDVKFHLKFKFTPPVHNMLSSSSSSSLPSKILPQKTEVSFSLRVFDSKATTTTTNNITIMPLIGGDVLIPPYMHRISSSYVHTCSEQVGWIGRSLLIN